VKIVFCSQFFKSSPIYVKPRSNQESRAAARKPRDAAAVLYAKLSP